MSDSNFNGMPEGYDPNGTDGGSQPSQNEQSNVSGQYDAGQQNCANQQYGGQYGQQQNGANQQYGGQYGQQQYGVNQQYAGQYGQQQYGANQQYGGQYGQQQNGANQQNAGQYGQQQYGANQQYAGQYGQQQYDANQQYGGQYGQQQNGANQQYGGQYGQQQYDANQQYVAGGQVYSQTMNMYGDQAHKPETPKKRKGIKIAIITVIAVLVVIAAVVAVYMLFIKKSPKENVESAFENTAKELEKNNAAGVIDADEFDLDNMEIQSRFTIDNVAQADQYNGTQLEINGATAFGDSNDFQLDGAMTVAGETVTAKILALGNKIYFSSPELFTKTFLLDADSILAEVSGAEAGAGGTADGEALAKIIDEDLKPATDRLKDSIVYEYTGKEEFENANGSTVKAEHYTVTITKDALIDYGNDMMDCFNKYVDSNMSDEMLSQMNVSKDQLKQVIGMIPSMMGAMFTKDIVADVYVDNDKLVRLDAKYDIASAGVTAGVTVDFMGNKDVTSDTKAVVSMNYGTDVSLALDCTYKSSTDGDETTATADYTLSATSYGDTQTMSGTSKFSYNEKSGAMVNNMQLNVDSHSVFLNYTATLADVNKGKSFSLNDMKLSLGADDQEMVGLSGNIKVSEKKSTFSAPADGDVVDYSVLSGDDADQYINTENLQKITEAWGDVLGSAKTDGYLGDSDDPADEPDVTTEAATEVVTEEATTEAATKKGETTEEVTTEADTESADYSKEVLKVGDKTVKVNDPDGYERSYASSYSISLNKNDGSDYVYYVGYEGMDAASCLKYTKEEYDNIEEDETTKINSIKDGKVKAGDGTEVGYIMIQETSYDIDTAQVAFFYPVGEDTIMCTVSLWDSKGDVDVQKMCDLYINAMEIK